MPASQFAHDCFVSVDPTARARSFYCSASTVVASLLFSPPSALMMHLPTIFPLLLLMTLVLFLMMLLILYTDSPVSASMVVLVESMSLSSRRVLTGASVASPSTQDRTPLTRSSSPSQLPTSLSRRYPGPECQCEPLPVHHQPSYTARRRGSCRPHLVARQ